MSLPPEDRAEIIRLASAIAQQSVKNTAQGRGGISVPVPLTRLANVQAIAAPGEETSVRVDGDSTIIAAINATGLPLPEAARVLVTFLPPSGVYVTHSIHGVRPSGALLKGTTQSIPDNTITVVTWAVGNIGHLTGGVELQTNWLVVPVRGMYACHGSVGWDSYSGSTAQVSYVQLYKVDVAGTLVAQIDVQGDTMPTVSSGYYMSASHPCFVFDAGEAMVMRCYHHRTAGALNITQADMSLVWVGHAPPEV